MAYEDFLADLADGMADLLEELGTTVSYRQLPEDAFDLTVIWTDATGQPITAFCCLAHFPTVDGAQLAPRKGDEITRGGHVYSVRDIARDGTGGATFDLRLLRGPA